MRQIKFRAWNTRRKTIDIINDLYWFEENMCHHNGDNEYIIQQFTGLKDANGVDIYEGDIVEWTEEQKLYRESVTFDRGVFWADLPLYEVNKVCKVVGNIFED